jgi:hypothetical protein
MKFLQTSSVMPVGYYPVVLSITHNDGSSYSFKSTSAVVRCMVRDSPDEIIEYAELEEEKKLTSTDLYERGEF